MSKNHLHDDVIKWKHFLRYWPFVRATGGFPSQRPVVRNFDVFFDLCQNKRLSKLSKCRWFETLSRPLWRHIEVQSPGRLVEVHAIHTVPLYFKTCIKLSGAETGIFRPNQLNTMAADFMRRQINAQIGRSRAPSQSPSFLVWRVPS